MLILGIDTASPLQSVALISNGKLLVQKKWKGKWDESSTVLPNIALLLRRARKSFQDLNGIAVSRGPGSFSSVRIGVTIANTLAYTLGIPVYGFSPSDIIDFSKNFKESMLRNKQETVEPIYSKPPHITISKKASLVHYG